MFRLQNYSTIVRNEQNKSSQVFAASEHESEGNMNQFRVPQQQPSARTVFDFTEQDDGWFRSRVVLCGQVVISGKAVNG